MKQHLFRQRLAAFFLALVALLLLGTPAGAQSKTFNWEDWHSDITLLENGDLRIEETQTLNFQGEPFTFGYRSLDTGVAGANDGITDVSLREGDRIYEQSSSRAPGTFRVSRDGDETRIDWYFEPAVGRRTYTFTYTVKGGVNVGTLEEGSGDQIFWKVIPGDHPAYVNRSSATITLPPGVAPQQYTGTTDYLVAAYTNGQERDDVAISVSPDGRTISFVNESPVLPDDTFEVRVQFPHGLLPIPVPAWQQQMQTADTVSLGLLVVALLVLVGGPLGVLLLWYTRGRDPELATVVPTYISEPPDDTPPAVVGTLIDEQADMQDIVSTQVDLAHRGYLTMTESKKDFTFERTDKPADDLRPFEQRYLRDIFEGQSEVKLSSLRYEFADNLPHLRTLVYEELVDRGLFYGKPDSVRQSYGCLAGALLGLAGLSFGALALFAGEGVSTLLCIPLAIAVTAGALFIAARAMPKKTPAGVEAAAKWEAFKAYLSTIEKQADSGPERRDFRGIPGLRDGVRHRKVVDQEVFGRALNAYPHLVPPLPAHYLGAWRRWIGRRQHGFRGRRWYAQSGRYV